MKKIAIVTMIGYKNYGNRLQNYALTACLKKYNNDVVTFWSNEKKIYIKNFIKQFIPSKRVEKKRFDKFDAFNNKFIKKKHINFKNYNSKKLENEFDCYVIGSDQVWNYNFLIKFPEYGGFNFFFLEKINSSKCISYAASFGVDTIEEKYMNDYKLGLSNIKYLSVREEAGKSIAEKITHREDIQVLIDPTMLLNADEWGMVAKPIFSLEGKKYILNYFLGNLSDQRRMVIEKIAKENNCTVINLLDKDSEYYATGPSEFLYLERNAFLICTDSFHSCVFAFIFDRPFIVFDREDNNENMSSRIDTLLEKFELNDRRYNDNIKNINIQHDYSKGYKILNEERKKSFKFLEKALGIKDSE